jgi:hypothetical protein
MNDFPLNKDTFLLYCSKNYDGGFIAGMEEMNEDLNRIKYIKKLVTRYEQNDDLKERLILNHIIVLYNVFGAKATSRILYFKMKDEFHIIKPFLVLIGILPEKYYNIDGVKAVDTNEISMDSGIIEALRKI